MALSRFLLGAADTLPCTPPSPMALSLSSRPALSLLCSTPQSLAVNHLGLTALLIKLTIIISCSTATAGGGHLQGQGPGSGVGRSPWARTPPGRCYYPVSLTRRQILGQRVCQRHGTENCLRQKPWFPTPTRESSGDSLGDAASARRRESTVHPQQSQRRIQRAPLEHEVWTWSAVCDKGPLEVSPGEDAKQEG